MVFHNTCNGNADCALGITGVLIPGNHVNWKEFQVRFWFKKALYLFCIVLCYNYPKMLLPLVSVANRNPQEVSTDI